MWLLVIASCAAAYYAAYAKIQDITWSVPIIYTVVLVLYIMGIMLKDKGEEEIEVNNEGSNNQN